MKYNTTYKRQTEGLITEFRFVQGDVLPVGVSISTPITFPFIGENLVIAQMKNGWWDVPGGKVESGETWLEALHRGVNEECGVTVTNIRMIGHIMTKNSGDLNSLQHDAINVIPVTTSFVATVDRNWIKRETVSRDAPARDTVRELFEQRDDSGQLLEIFNYVIDDFKSQKYTTTFEYVKNGSSKLEYPITQSVVFIKNSNNQCALVREVSQSLFTLPGGGCHMDETGIACAVRESLEEAQISITNVKHMGSVVTRILKNTHVLSVSMQNRYIADADEYTNYASQKDGFEITERRFFNIDSLQENAVILQNPTGNDIMEDLKNYV